MLVEIDLEPAEIPRLFESVMLHITPGRRTRALQEIHLVQCCDQACPISTQVAVKINRPIALISKDEKDPVDVFF